MWAFFLDSLWPRFYQRSVKVHDRCEWLTYVRLLAPSIAAQLFGCFVLLDAGPYRLEGGGITSGFILPLRLMDKRGRKSQRERAKRGVVGDEMH